MSSAPVIARNTPDSTGATHSHRGEGEKLMNAAAPNTSGTLRERRWPSSTSSAATRYAPAAMPFVQV
jgi:hypothetical protein